MFLSFKIKLFILLCFANFNLMAKDISLTFNFENKNKEINQTIKNVVYQYKDFFDIENLKINILEIDKNNLHFFGFSNADKKNCNIRIFVSEIDFEEKDFLIFTVLHEIAHCYIGKNVLLKNKKDWNIEIDSKRKEKIQYFIDQKTKELLNDKSKREFHPNVLWHEIAADIFALDWIYKRTGEIDIILNVLEKRMEEDIKNPTLVKQPSTVAIKEMLFKILKNEDYDILKMIDSSFLSHIEFLIHAENSDKTN